MASITGLSFFFCSALLKPSLHCICEINRFSTRWVRSLFCSQTKQNQDSNPRPLGSKRERYPLCYAAPQTVLSFLELGFFNRRTFHRRSSLWYEFNISCSEIRTQNVSVITLPPGYDIHPTFKYLKENSYFFFFFFGAEFLSFEL